MFAHVVPSCGAKEMRDALGGQTSTTAIFSITRAVVGGGRRQVGGHIPQQGPLTLTLRHLTGVQALESHSISCSL